MEPGVHLNGLQSELLKLSEAYRLEMWQGTPEEQVHLAVVRHVDRHGAGLEIREELPVPGRDLSSGRGPGAIPREGAQHDRPGAE